MTVPGHRYRLGALIVDCAVADLDAAARFWAAALGYAAEPGDGRAEDRYRILRGRPGSLPVEVQAVSGGSGLHVDIETDDVMAELDRLERLGARRLRAVRDWWVMEAPTGHRFCVVPLLPADRHPGCPLCGR
ncbi:MAG TPA: VOC family protein [Nevskiaceae bacterium]|nr:VOC family protein [Nevskiaceae bacterium]